MNKETKKKTIELGELKKIKVRMPKKWLHDLYRRYHDKDECIIDVKDLINKIIDKMGN